jgi:hypothetical protein
MDAGRIVEQGEPLELLVNLATDVTITRDSYFAYLVRLTGTENSLKIL